MDSKSAVGVNSVLAAVADMPKHPSGAETFAGNPMLSVFFCVFLLTSPTSSQTAVHLSASKSKTSKLLVTACLPVDVV